MGRALMELKSTAFGGFNKESVLHYLRDMAVAHSEETSSLHQQIQQLQQQLEMTWHSRQQQEMRLNGLEQMRRIADAIQNQSRVLEQLLEENRRLQAELDTYRGRETAIQELEHRVQQEAEALRAQVRSECQMMRENAVEEMERLIQAKAETLAALSELSEEFSALCRKGEQLVQRQS